MRNAPSGKALRKGVEVVNLAPSGFEEEITEEEPHQQRREPSKPIRQAESELHQRFDHYGSLRRLSRRVRGLSIDVTIDASGAAESNVTESPARLTPRRCHSIGRFGSYGASFILA